MNAKLGMWFVGLLAFECAAISSVPEVSVVKLRCEYQANPVGIDVPQPRLGWQVAGGGRGVRQTAYRVTVSTAPDRDGDAWDSGRVPSDQSQHVRYGGEPLRPFTRYLWKVQVWAGDSSATSETAIWTTGVLQGTPWPAPWIAASGSGGISLAGATWIWAPDRQEGLMHPPCTRYFRWKVRIPDDAVIERGAIVMTADNSFTLTVNGRPAGTGDAWNVLHQLDVTRFLRPGGNLLAVEVVNGGTSLNEAGLIGKLEITLANGERIVSALDASTPTAAVEQAGWKTVGFDDSAWQPARVLGAFGMQPWGEPAVTHAALPLFRRALTIAKPVRRATAAVCGLGFHELRINGEKVSRDELEPGWTNYRKTCLASVYDVTLLLSQGDNVLGIMLGNGMYNVRGGRYTKFRGSFGEPKLTLVLHVEYVDGTTESVTSDQSWRCASGPVLFSCIFGGEDYDARRELDGWDRSGFDATAWTPAKRVDGPGGRVTTRLVPPILAMETFTPVKIAHPRPGIYVYDLGQNFSGWPKLTLSGPAGSRVKLVPGELLGADGLVSQRSSGGPVWFSYILKGKGHETWRPRFTYYGFRYVQVEGAEPVSETAVAVESPRVHALTGEFLYPSSEIVGRFVCANSDVNRVHDLILSAIKSNFKSVLTDCPHREKLGWLECSHLLAGCFMYNFDCARFYQKIAGDMREAQLDNGMVPDIAPEYTLFGAGFRDSPEWGSAMVIAPWRAYRMYGDVDILRENYESMQRYVAYLGRKASGHIVAHGLGDWYDIGPGSPGPSKLTSLGLTSTGVYYQNIEILRQTAALLGKDEDVRTYAQLANDVQVAFNATFFRPAENHYDRNSQTGNSMPLFLGVVPPVRQAAVLENVVESIRANGNRVTAGDVGFYYVVQALLDGGRSDVLYDMLCQTDGPGYMYQLQKGATSLTEAWDTNPGSSQNHCMLGHIEEWFYSGLLGIRAAVPGFKQIIIKPAMPADLAWAAGHYDCVYGRIASRWERGCDRATRATACPLTMNVTIPPNTTATVYVPAKDLGSVSESGRPVATAAGVTFLRMEGGACVCTVGSGTYMFRSE